MGVLRATSGNSRNVWGIPIFARKPEKQGLEAIVRERLVGVGHAVHFVAPSHRAATALGRFHEFAGETGIHRLFAALAGGLPDPAHGKGRAPHRPHLDRNLVVRAAHATAFHFHHGLDVTHRLTEHPQRILAGLPGDLLESTVDDAFGNRLLAVGGDHIDELGYILAPELGIRKDVALRYFSSAWHG